MTAMTVREFKRFMLTGDVGYAKLFVASDF
jgi:hypothetical protein